MHAGFMLIGDGTLDSAFNFEIINSARAWAYACNAGMPWITSDCDPCETTGTVLPGGPDYSDPATDGAPWYDPDDPDTASFLGVMGLEVIGAEDSTRTAIATTAATGGGVISALSFKPRTMTVRVLAMATDECGMQAGLNWMRCQYAANQDNCEGDVMTFFDCCPCACVNEGLGQVCWIDHYFELPGDPVDCDVDWWPSTYAELRDGPTPDETEDWCSWLKSYRQLATTGPPGWACCTEQCVVPYLRQFHNVRIIGGPTVLKLQPMNSRGWIATIEFIVVAADPAEYGMPDTAARFTLDPGSGTPHTDPPVPIVVPPPDPWAIPGWTVPRRIDFVAPPVTPPDPPPTEWRRTITPMHLRPNAAALNTMTTTLELTALEAVGPVRVGLWRGEQLIAGTYVPGLPAGARLNLARGRATATNVDGTTRDVGGYARSFDGSPGRWDTTIPPGDLSLSIDRAVDDTGQLHVEVLAVAKGCA